MPAIISAGEILWVRELGGSESFSSGCSQDCVGISGRAQRAVEENGATSGWQQVTCGVPQTQFYGLSCSAAAVYPQQADETEWGGAFDSLEE